MEFTINTPALLFPAMSLLLLAYTNRFNVIASRIRSLRDLWKTERDEKILFQIHNLRRRVNLIRRMQMLGVFCMFGCVLTMFLLFNNEHVAGQYAFGISLLLMLASLSLSIREVHLSVVSLDIVLIDLEEDLNKNKQKSEEVESNSAKKYFG